MVAADINGDRIQDDGTAGAVIEPDRTRIERRAATNEIDPRRSQPRKRENAAGRPKPVGVSDVDGEGIRLRSKGGDAHREAEGVGVRLEIVDLVRVRAGGGEVYRDRPGSGTGEVKGPHQRIPLDRRQVRGGRVLVYPADPRRTVSNAKEETAIGVEVERDIAGLRHDKVGGEHGVEVGQITLAGLQGVALSDNRAVAIAG